MGPAVSKGIYFMDGRKVNGVRSSKMTLNLVDADGYLESVSWKDFKESNLPDSSSDHAKGEFIKALVVGLSFQIKVYFNSFVRKGEVSFEDKVVWLLKNGAKYSKKGIKSV